MIENQKNNKGFSEEEVAHYSVSVVVDANRVVARRFVLNKGGNSDLGLVVARILKANDQKQ